MSKEAFEDFRHSLTEEEKISFSNAITKEKDAGNDIWEACAAYGRAKGFDVTAEDFRNGPRKLSEEDLEHISGGDMLYKPVIDAIMSMLHVHDFYPTGKEEEGTQYLFWKKRKLLYKCRICGLEEWREEN